MGISKDSSVIALLVCSITIISFTLTECCTEVAKKCRDENQPSNLPGNEEELADYCDKAIQFLECAQNTKDECVDEPEFYERVEQISPFMKKICAKGTGLYEDLADNLPCIKSNIPQIQMQCRILHENENTSLTFLAAIRQEEVMELPDVTDEETENCLDYMFFKSCDLGSLRNRCGAPARDVSLEIMEMMESLPAFSQPCDQAVNAKTRDLLRVMESEILDKRRRRK